MKKGKKRFMACLLAVAMVLSTLLELPGGLSGKLGLSLTAHAAVTASKPEGDGSAATPYQIGTVAELYWFAGLVNGDASVCTGGVTQNPAANAVLTADITINENLVDANGDLNSGEFETWTPIGYSDNLYTGTFDGNGKTIRGLYFSYSDGSAYGLFGYTDSEATIRNVGITESYLDGGTYWTGGVCGNNNGGTIENCYANATISGNVDVGGVCGQNSGTITNCYSAGKVSGNTYVGGVCGENYGTIENCYYDRTAATVLYAVDYNDGYDCRVMNVLGKTTEQFARGEVTYLLNGSANTGNLVWGQTLTGDAPDKYPVFHNDSNTVYATKGCVTYNNTGDESEKEHATDGDGCCSTCGRYVISTKEQLLSFAAKVNKGKTEINAVLTDDIVINENVLDAEGNLILDTESATAWTPIGTDDRKYRGTFEGNGHTISGLYFSSDDFYTGSYVGLFGSVGSNGSVSNVGVEDSYIYSGDGKRVSGLCGKNEGAIEGCYFRGTVYGDDYVGGVCGQNTGSVKSCYVSAKVEGAGCVGAVCGTNRGNEYENGAMEDCYYEIASDVASAVGQTVAKVRNVLGKTTDQFAKGEVTYLLNGSTSTDNPIWGQNIGTDTYPEFYDGTNRVYATKGCVTYNNEGDTSEKKHNYEEGICTGCGGYEAPEKDENDVYQISKASDLYWFADYVNTENSTASAILTDDIIVNENVLDKDGKLILNNASATVWTPIGSQTEYCGTFDGNGHTISGLYFYNESTDDVGLFSCVGEGGSVSNVGILDSYFYGDNDIGGVCGENYGTVKNSYFIGAVGGTSFGAICAENHGTIEDCYYNNTFASYLEAVEYNGGKTRNVSGKTISQFASGEVTYLLNGSVSTGNPVWGQTLTGGAPDAHPVSHTADNTVYATKGCVTYNNTGDESVREHTPGENNICTGCGMRFISTKEQLFSFAEAVENGESYINAVLTEDITVNENVLDADGKLILATESAIVWTPIGTKHLYTGAFDGNGHTISGLYFSDGNVGGIGLFAHVGEGGSVSNVGILDSYFYGEEQIGGVSGYNKGTIRNCYYTGVVDKSYDMCGGICGYNDGTVENCYYNKTMNPTWDAVSYNNGTIKDALGKTTSQFASGEVTYLLNGSASTGNLVWGQTLTGDAPDAHPVSHTADNTVYATKGCVTYNNTGDESEKEHVIGENGTCTGCGMCIISTKDHLFSFAEAVNNGETNINAVLTCDITVNENVLSEDGNLRIATGDAISWTPIGSDSYKYNGTFDGRGHTISGLYFSNESQDYVGLFGYVEEYSVISNVNVSDSYLRGAGYVGGVCGCNYGTIKASTNTGTVSGSDKYVGGVCGRNYGTVEASTNTGAVSGDYRNVGGVCGRNSSGTIEASTNTGTVSGSSKFVGGVCGSNYGTIEASTNTGAVSGDSASVGGVCGNNDGGTIQGCRNGGSVTGKNYIGGVCGESSDGTIEGSCNTGAVNGSDYIGGVCGGNDGYTGEGTVETSYNTGAVNGSSENVGGVCGFNGAIIRECYNGGSVTGESCGVGGVCGSNYVTIEASCNGGSVTGGDYDAGGVCGYNEDGAITNCYNTGSVSSKGTSIGGVCGENNYGTISGCYYNSDICTAGAVKLEDVEGKAVGLTTLQMTAPDALTTMNFSSEVWEKKPADTQQKKAFYPSLKAIEDDEPSISYEAEIAFKNTNTNTNPVYGEDLTFALENVTVKFTGSKDAISLLAGCKAEDFKLIYKGESIGSFTASGSAVNGLIKGGVDAGEQTIEVQYVGTDYDYFAAGTCQVTIAKATANEVKSPSATNAIVYGKKLSDVTLSDTNWNWVDGTIVPTVKNNGYAAVLKVTDDNNYDYSAVAGYDAASHTITRTIAVTVTEKENDVLIGDVNGDGNITAEDALSILKHVVGLEELTGDALTSADVNGENGITAEDALDVLKKVVGLLDKFKAEM